MELTEWNLLQKRDIVMFGKRGAHRTIIDVFIGLEGSRQITFTSAKAEGGKISYGQSLAKDFFLVRKASSIARDEVRRVEVEPTVRKVVKVKAPEVTVTGDKEVSVAFFISGISDSPIKAEFKINRPL